MSRFLNLTFLQSARKPLAVEVVRAERYERAAAASLLALVGSWLAYTRFYFWLQPRHLTYDGPFMYLTGKPDPACGLTRTFAWMWRGDLAEAVRVYPLGPLIFIGSLVLVAYLSAVIVGGRSLRLGLSSVIQRRIVVVALLAVGLNWASKLLWLGM